MCIIIRRRLIYLERYFLDIIYMEFRYFRWDIFFYNEFLLFLEIVQYLPQSK